MISKLQGRISELYERVGAIVGAGAAPERLAEAFADLDNNQQARFLDRVGELFRGFEPPSLGPDTQCLSIVQGTPKGDKGALGEPGRWFVETLAGFLS
jgi:hypothetical protein